MRTLAAGSKFGQGRFTLKKILGQGGMGTVWLAQDERLDELVALKFLPPQVRFDAVGLAGLRRETQRSRKLSHPNIVRIHDLHETEGEDASIAMEYVAGMTLSALRLTQPNEVLTWARLAPLVKQLCDALDYAHGEKVIHRDLKPANLMIDSNGRLKLADFGIASVISDSMSRVSNQPASGTLPYMSPQQINGERPQVTDDIYSLGATLYELLTGTPPFHSGQILHQVLKNEPVSPTARLAESGLENEIPPDVEAMIMACLAKDPSCRPQSARAVADWIGLQPTPHPQSLAATVSQSADGIVFGETSPRKKGIWISIGIFVLLVSVALGWFLKTKKSPPISTTPAKESEANVSSFASSGEDAAAYPQPRAWIDATEKIRSDGLKNGKLKTDGDWLTLAGDKNQWINLGSGRNYSNTVVRVVFSRGIDIALRNSEKSYYGHVGQHASISLVGSTSRSNTDLQGNIELPIGYLEQAAHELVFAAQDDKLNLWLDGKEIARVTDQTLQKGAMQLVLYAGQERQPHFRKVEYGELDASVIGHGDGSNATNVGQIVLTENFEALDEEGKPARHGGWKLPAAGEKRTVRTEKGNNFLEYQASTTTNFMHPVSANLNLKPEWKTLRVSFRLRTQNLKSPADWSGATLSAGFADELTDAARSWRTIKEYRTPFVRTNSDWQLLEKTLPVPPDAKHLALSPILAYASGVADFDDIKVAVVEENPPVVLQAPVVAANNNEGAVQRTNSAQGTERVIFADDFENPAPPGKSTNWNWANLIGKSVVAENRNHFLRLESTDVSKGCKLSAIIPLPPEWQKIIFSARIRTRDLKVNSDNLYGGVKLLTEFLDESKAVVLVTSAPSVKQDSNWGVITKLISIKVKDALASARYVRVSPYLDSAAGIGDFDDIKVTVVEENRTAR